MANRGIMWAEIQVHSPRKLLFVRLYGRSFSNKLKQNLDCDEKEKAMAVNQEKKLEESEKTEQTISPTSRLKHSIDNLLGLSANDSNSTPGSTSMDTSSEDKTSGTVGLQLSNNFDTQSRTLLLLCTWLVIASKRPPNVKDWKIHKVKWIFPY